jgi:hypothetical protein
MTDATASEVRIEIDTTLGDTEINNIISRVERDIEREMDSPPSSGTDKRKDLEAVVAALFIAETRDRSASKVQTGRTSKTYEQSQIDKLRGRAKRLGAPDSLLNIDASKPTASVGVPDAKGID